MSAIREEIRKRDGADPSVGYVLAHVVSLPEKPLRQVNAFIGFVRARRQRAGRAPRDISLSRRANPSGVRAARGLASGWDDGA